MRVETTLSWRQHVENEVASRRVERASGPPWHWTQALRPEARLAIDDRSDWPAEIFLKWAKHFENENRLSSPTIEALSRRVDSAVTAAVTQARAGNILIQPSVGKRARIEEEQTGNFGLSDRTLAAFNTIWAMEFGSNWANPFRIRLTPEACETLGMSEYYQKISNPCDLALIKQRLSQYETDKALRQDIALIAANARKFYPPGSPIIGFSDSMLQTFDECAGIDEEPS